MELGCSGIRKNSGVGRAMSPNSGKFGYFGLANSATLNWEAIVGGKQISNNTHWATSTKGSSSCDDS
jgi:hypothetical protein